MGNYKIFIKKEEKMIRFTTLVFLCISASVFAEPRVERNVAYGKDERNIMDIYWDNDFKNAPIVITIHGGGFIAGSKEYCTSDMQKFYKDKGCIVVSPNYRLVKDGGKTTREDCVIDVAMAVAWIQENAKKFGGDPNRIVSTGSSAGGYISHAIAYNKRWKWPRDAQYKPKKLNVIGWFGDSPYISPQQIKGVRRKTAPAFILYGGPTEHPSTRDSVGRELQKQFIKKKVWNKFVYVEHMGHCPRQIIFSTSSRDQESYVAYNAFIDMVCFKKGKPTSGDIINVKKK